MRPICNVTHIVNDGKKASGVIYKNVVTGEEYEQPAEVVILASYVFNNVKLLLTSKLGKPYNPENGTGVIGKNYAYQVFGGKTTGFFDEKKFNLYMGAGALGIEIPEFVGDNFDHTDLNFIHGAGIRMFQYGSRPIDNNSVPKDTPLWGKEFKQQSIKYANSVLSVAVQGASMPARSNFLDLDPTYKDVYGLPLLRMTFDWTEQDKQLSSYMAKITEKIVKEMGADKIGSASELTSLNICLIRTRITLAASLWATIKTPRPSIPIFKCGMQKMYSSSAPRRSRITAASIRQAR